MAKQKINLSLSDEAGNKLRIYAAVNRENMSDVVEAALREYFEKKNWAIAQIAS